MPSHTRKPASRPSLKSFLANADRKKLAIAGGIGGVIILVLVLIVVTGKSTPSAAPGNTTPTLSSNKCPLTDLPAPGGKAPQREPLAVKIGNETSARPQSGLNEADVVYDTPAEGGIMRYVAIFQCQSASKIGPIRSVRWVDSRIISVFHHVALAFVGGVTPNQDNIAATPWIDNANDFVHSAPYFHDPSRVAPDATYSSTTALLGLFAPRPAPAPIFKYTESLPASASAASKIAINFSAGTDVVWNWNSSTSQWDHTYSGTPDMDALSNTQVSTTNIVVQIVKWKYGPYVESTGGTGDIESQVIGTGKGFLFRNGKEIPITWHRSSARSATIYKDASGQQIGLAPGRTWVEMLLDTTYANKGALTVTP